jgi:(2Fe-2S) ferredoxin
MKVLVCTKGRKCRKRGSKDVLMALRDAVDELDLGERVKVKRVGCFGICGKGPVVYVKRGKTCYVYVTESDCEDIARSLEETEPVARLVLKKGQVKRR